jgi:hypothetical protein
MGTAGVVIPRERKRAMSGSWAANSFFAPRRPHASTRRSVPRISRELVTISAASDQ